MLYHLLKIKYIFQIQYDKIINKGFAMGASDYIKRPFDYRIVYRRVYNIIKLYAKQKRLMDLLKKQVEKN